MSDKKDETKAEEKKEGNIYKGAESTYIKPEDLRIGLVVKDNLSGLIGMILNKATTYYGLVQWNVRELRNDGSNGEEGWKDPQFLYLVDAHPKNMPLPVAPEPTDIELGDIVKSVSSDYQGFVNERIEHYNGCVHFSVVAKDAGLKEGISRYGQSFPSSMLTIVKKAKEAPAAKAKTTPKPEAPRQGSNLMTRDEARARTQLRD